MADSVKQVLQEFSCKADAVLLRKALDAIASDLTQIVAKHNALTAKLDADATVTDTNYTALTGITNPQTLP